MTDEQYKSLSDKIEELTQTLKDQSTELQNGNMWLQCFIIFTVTFLVTSLLIKIIT